MTLPMNVMPTYNTIIPSLNKKIKYKPFTVKEEKALLVAQQSEDPVVMLDTLKEVLRACIMDKIDVDSLAVFDIEYLFTQLRAVSVGEIAELRFRCDKCKDDPKAVAQVNINLTELKVKFPPNHEKKFSLFNDVGIVMKYPGLEALKSLEQINDFNDINQVFELVVNSIDYIYDQDQVYHAKDLKKEELVQFIEQLDSKQFKRITEFFRTMPTLRQDIQYQCPVCGHVHNKYIEGLSSFF